jgi:hypothetical protein
MLLTAAYCGEYCVPIVMLELLRLCDRIPWRVREGWSGESAGVASPVLSNTSPRDLTSRFLPQINRLLFASFYPRTNLPEQELQSHCFCGYHPTQSLPIYKTLPLRLTSSIHNGYWRSPHAEQCSFRYVIYLHMCQCRILGVIGLNAPIIFLKKWLQDSVSLLNL